MKRTFGWVVIALAVAVGAAGQEQKFGTIGDLKLTGGGVIPDCRVGYRTFGTLNARKSNAVLFPTWFSGRTEDLAGLIGPGKLADSSKWFVIAVDALGGGVSSSPSNSAAPFPKITIRDMVNSQHELLTKVLKIEHLHAVMGISMGGMQTFQWLTAYPEFFDKAVPIVGSPKLTPIDMLLWKAELDAIRAGGARAMPAVNAMHQFALYTPGYRVSHEDFSKIEPGLQDSRMAFTDWAAQLEAMMAQDIGPVDGVKAKVLIVVATEDHMVNPSPALKIAPVVKAQVVKLTGDCGHMATSCESGKMVGAVAKFL